ncbi:MAG TPA: uroporphyrinogen-III synthase [Spirillospora sp.]|nr:uroporphyrinogen-III synthase [Spirillospora sp.]
MNLNGKRIVVTRAAHQAGALADLLRAHGAEPLLYPCIAIAPPEDTAALDAALRRAADGAFDWLILTSSNTVEALRHRCETLGLSLRGMRAAAVGPATARAAQESLGVDVQIVPDEHVAEALAESLHLTPGARVFLPQANLARADLRDSLAAAGADVTVSTAYRTMMGQGGVDLPARLRAGLVDAITFTSSSTVENCLTRVEDEGGDLNHLRAVPAACIGPKTAETARAAGFGRVLTPDEYTLAGLVDILENEPI